jgi:hypothetical protein
MEAANYFAFLMITIIVTIRLFVSRYFNLRISFLGIISISILALEGYFNPAI